MQYYKNMKKILLIFMILLFCAVGCIAFLACDSGAESPKPLRLEQWMDGEDVFDLLEKSFGFAIILKRSATVADEYYRFVRGVGYTKFEEGVYDGVVIDEKENKTYRLHEYRDDRRVTKEPLKADIYDEIDEVYFHYVKLLRDSFENMRPQRPVEFEVTDDGYMAIIKMLMPNGTGDYSVITCEISNVNNTKLFFPEEFKDYKTLAVDA